MQQGLFESQAITEDFVFFIQKYENEKLGIRFRWLKKNRVQLFFRHKYSKNSDFFCVVSEYSEQKPITFFWRKTYKQNVGKQKNLNFLLYTYDYEKIGHFWGDRNVKRAFISFMCKSSFFFVLPNLKCDCCLLLLFFVSPSLKCGCCSLQVLHIIVA